MLASAFDARPLDTPPFSWLSMAASVVALYVTAMILAVQHAPDQTPLTSS